MLEPIRSCTILPGPHCLFTTSTWIIGGETGRVLFPAPRWILEDREDGDERDAACPRDRDIESLPPPPGPSERP